MFAPLLLAVAMTGQCWDAPYFDYGLNVPGVNFQLSIGPRRPRWRPQAFFLYGPPAILQEQVDPYGWYAVIYDNRRMTVWGRRLPDGTIWWDTELPVNQQMLRRPKAAVSPEAGP
jgi:hypothetical protein